MRSPLLQVSLRSDSEDFWRTMSVASMPCTSYESGSRHLKTFKFTGTQIWPKIKTCEPTGKHTIFIVLAVDSSCTSKWLVTWGISVTAFQSAHPHWTLRPKTWRAGQGILWVARGWRGHVFLPMIWDVYAGVISIWDDPIGCWNMAESFVLDLTLWWFNIAMGNGPFIVDFPIKHGDFP
jgi:hypothetical protein